MVDPLAVAPVGRPHRGGRRLAVAGLLALAVLLGLWLAVDNPPRPAVADAPVPAPAPPAASGAPLASPRTEAPPLSTAPAATGSDRSFALQLELVDRWGLSVQPHGMLLGPPGALVAVGGTEWVGSTVKVQCAAHADQLRLACAERTSTGYRGLRQITLHAGPPARLRFLLGDREVPDAWLLGLSPGVGPMPEALPRFASALRSAAELADGMMVLGSSTIGITPPPSFGRVPTGRVEGVVRDGSGAPAAQVLVAVVSERDGRWLALQRTTTDAAGRFAFSGLPDRELRLRAGGSGEGVVVQTVTARDGATVACELHLALGPHLRGRVVDDTGARIAGWQLVYDGLDAPAVAMATSAADGTFVLPVEAGSRGRLLAFAAGDDAALPVVVLDPVGPGQPEVAVVAVRPLATAGFQVRVPKAIATEAPGFPQALVQIYQEASDRGACLAAADDGETFRIGDLPAGFYRLVVASLTHGRIDLGRHWCDGRGTQDLGTVALPALATLWIDARGAAREHLWLWRCEPDLDLRIDGLDLTAAEGVLLPPGDYVLCRQEGAQLTRTAFSLQAGERRRIAAAR